jgi:hypothetical protein
MKDKKEAEANLKRDEIMNIEENVEDEELIENIKDGLKSMKDKSNKSFKAKSGIDKKLVTPGDDQPEDGDQTGKKTQKSKKSNESKRLKAEAKAEAKRKEAEEAQK